jgi:ABC-2 type transport system ATP-binding protein
LYDLGRRPGRQRSDPGALCDSSFASKLGGMIETNELTKEYGDKIAVDSMTFTVPAGVITGFLGPNGAGKSTTMRMILGLDRPTVGSAYINGKEYASFRAPLHQVGAMLEARSIHPGRSARSHLLAMAQTHGLARQRVDEVIAIVGLEDVAAHRVGTFSLGMAQRLGIAAALLGDPETVILDEPANGLDPEGIRWIRNLLKGLAAEGRTVFLSSHLMAEMAQTAERLVIVGRGRLIAETTVEELVKEASRGASVRVRSPQAAELREAIAGPDIAVRALEPGLLDVKGLGAEAIGEAAATRGVVIHELSPERVSLEDAFMQLTGDATEYTATAGTGVHTDSRLEVAA